MDKSQRLRGVKWLVAEPGFDSTAQTLYYCIPPSATKGDAFLLTVDNIPSHLSPSPSGQSSKAVKDRPVRGPLEGWFNSLARSRFSITYCSPFALQQHPLPRLTREGGRWHVLSGCAKPGIESLPLPRAELWGGHYQLHSADEKTEFILTKIRWQGSTSFSSSIISTQKVLPIFLNESSVNSVIFFLVLIEVWSFMFVFV